MQGSFFAITRFFPLVLFIQMNDLVPFSRELQKKIPKVCLIVSKEADEAIDIFLKNWKGKVKTFEGESFSSSDFCNEVGSLFLFDEPILCFVMGIDKLKEGDRKIVLNYLKNPNPKIHLLLSSATTLFVKEVTKQEGMVLQLAEEKVWQKKKRMEAILKQEATTEGISFSLDAIQYLIESVGSEKNLLFQEFEKLKAYTFEKKSISLRDVKELVQPKGFYTFWDLGEALFKKETLKAIHRSQALLEEGHSLFTILASLRTQIKTVLNMSISFESGGEASLVQEFPYLKGAILAKKVEEIKNNPVPELKRGLYLLFEAELKARSTNCDPLFILELLFGRFHDIVLTSESFRAK